MASSGENSPRNKPFLDGRRVLFTGALFILFIAYQAIVMLKQPPAATGVVFSDAVGYTTALLQQTDNTLFSRDTIYANHKFSDSIWASSAIYMVLLDFLYKVANSNIAVAFSLFRILLLALYIPLMFGLMYRILKNWWLAALLALLLSHPTSFTVTGTIWGIPSNLIGNPIVPATLYSVFSLGLAWAAYGLWFKPGAEGRPIPILHTLILAVMVSASVFLVHAISAVAAIELLILLGGVQALRGKLPFRSLAVFVVITIPAVIFRTFTGSGVPQQVSLPGASEVVRLGQDWMIFPWTSRWMDSQLHLANQASVSQALIVFFVFYAVICAASLILYLRAGQARRFAQYALVAIQGVYCLFFMSAGWVPLLLVGYGWNRLARREVDELDRGLFVALTLTNLIGPAQQTIVYYIWTATHLMSLSGILFEMARFQLLGYVPFYLLAGRAILKFSRLTDRSYFGILTAVVLSLQIVLNLQQTAAPIGLISGDQILLLAFLLCLGGYSILSHTTTITLGPLRLDLNRALPALFMCLAGWTLFSAFLATAEVRPVATTVILVGIAVIISVGWSQVRTRRLVPVGGVITILVIGAVGVLFSRSIIDDFNLLKHAVKSNAIYVTRGHPDSLPADPARPGVDAHAIDTAYLDVAAWVRAHTPADSLTFLSTLDPNFRVFAQRSTLITRSDTSLGLYAGIDPTILKKMVSQAQDLSRDPAPALCFLGGYKVDYFVTYSGAGYPDCVDGTTRYRGSKVYGNALFDVYKLETSVGQ